MLKSLLLQLTWLLLLPVLAKSQECSLQKTTDEFSNQPKLTSGFIELQSVKLSVDATNREIDYFFVINNTAANCFGDQSEALFVFEGGKQKLEVRNTGGDNCNGFFHITMRGGSYTPTLVSRLATKKVASITFTDRNDKKTIVGLTPDEQELLMKLSNCIAKEAKTLPK